jgi:hypothetical protein
VGETDNNLFQRGPSKQIITFLFTRRSQTPGETAIAYFAGESDGFRAQIFFPSTRGISRLNPPGGIG